MYIYLQNRPPDGTENKYHLIANSNRKKKKKKKTTALQHEGQEGEIAQKKCTNVHLLAGTSVPSPHSRRVQWQGQPYGRPGPATLQV